MKAKDKKKELAQKIKKPSKNEVREAMANHDNFRQDSKTRAYVGAKARGEFK